MRVFLDTNVLLDVLARREPFYDDAARLWALAERSEVEGFISAISFNNIYYIVRKSSGKAVARTSLHLMRDVFDWVAPDRNVINQAIDSEIDDFEDAVQFYCAVRAEVDQLISRNPSDFPTTGPGVVTPAEFLARWGELTADESDDPDEPG